MSIKIRKKEKYEPKHVQTAPAEPKAEVRVHPVARPAAESGAQPQESARPAEAQSARGTTVVPVHAVQPAPAAREHVSVHAKPSQARSMHNYVLGYVKDAHEQNQRRIHTGMILLYLLPLLVILIVALTGSNRIVFLIIWIVAMFGLAIFMLFVAYDDHELKKVLRELEQYVPDSWTDELDELTTYVGPEQLRQWVSQRLEREDEDEDDDPVQVPRRLLMRLMRRMEKETADEEYMADHQN